MAKRAGDDLQILTLNWSDIDGGAARASHRVASQLVELGVPLRMRVMRKFGNDPWVTGAEGLLEQIWARVLTRAERGVVRLSGVKDKGLTWSFNSLPNFMFPQSMYEAASVVHVNWIGKGTLPLSSIPKIKKPLVWTLHDSWAFTGGCHIPYECRRFENSCGNCPQLRSPAVNDASHRHWLKKAEYLAKTSSHFIAPSNWMAGQARASSLLGNAPISVIPNGLDTNVFRRSDKSRVREALELPQEKRLILFGAMYADTDQNKGLKFLLEALKILQGKDASFAEKYELVVFGLCNPASLKNLPIPVTMLGIISDDHKLAQIYSAADVTVVPSKMESFGQVALESLSCGTPVVAFATTGLTDIVKHLENGYLAEKFDTYDLANGILLMSEPNDFTRSLSLRARDWVLDKFDIKVTAGQYLALFESLSRSENAWRAS
ncbi:MAG TPA: glycosyltransferase [Sideroxyarcus sp.]|nr:glycosyltransferase [Sideroxyarcus sp.]